MNAVTAMPYLNCTVMAYIRWVFLALLLIAPSTALAKNLSDTHPHFGLSSAYDPTYAMDFDDCPSHFADGTPPIFAVQSHAYLNTQSDRSSDDSSISLCFKGFATYYSPISNTAVYSANHLTKRAAQNAKKLPRKDSFRPEVRLPPSQQIVPSLYKNSGYDRGHLVPNGDMPDVQTQYDSFSMVNIVPQNSEHNRNLWRQIEIDVRTLAEAYGEVYVITGTAYHGKRVSSVGDVFVPTHLYKAVYIPSINTAGVYYSPNDGSMIYDVVDVQTLTSWTGLVPFPSVTPNFNQSVFAGTLPKNDADTDEPDLWQLLWLIMKELWRVFNKH